MKKILFTMPTLHGGGAERVAAALAGELSSAADWEVHLLTYSRDPRKDYPTSDRVIRHSMPAVAASPLSRITGKVHFLRETIRRIEPDCVLSLAGPAMISLLSVAMSGTGIPLVLSERNDPKSYPAQPHLRMLRLWAYRKSTAMVFQTHEAMDFFPEDIRSKGCVIANPLTANLPEPHSSKREKRIVTSCRLTRQKNLDLLLDAFSDICAAYPEHTLHIYGDGPERQRLEERIRTMGLLHRVTLHGYCSSLYPEIVNAAMFVLSSDYEGISNSMLEAIALGIPTVCTDCPAGGARETIASGQNGLLVPVGNRRALAEAMMLLLSDEDYAEALGRQGVHLREKISVRSIAAQWKNLIERTIEREQCL